MSNSESVEYLIKINNTLELILEELKKSNNRPPFNPPNIMDLFGNLSRNNDDDDDDDDDDENEDNEDNDDDDEEEEEEEGENNNNKQEKNTKK
jgi:hypothetical protein